MVTPSSTAAPQRPLPQPLSYADLAKRANVPQTSAPVPARPADAVVNEDGGSGATSPASSSRNITPASSVALTRTGSPPPSSSQAGCEESTNAVALTPKSPTKPSPPNFWAARKEQMASRATVQQQQTAAVDGSHSPPRPVQKPGSTTATSVNGVGSNSTYPDERGLSDKNDDDPFVVRVPPRGLPTTAAVNRSPPSLDDAESWPEMGKAVNAISISSSLSGITATSSSEGDKKELPNNSHKKGERTKWVPIPASELQAAHDAQVRSTAHGHSHHRNNPAKSRSRQQSDARKSLRQSQRNNSSTSVTGQFLGTAKNSGSGFTSSDASANPSLPGSAAQSRTTSQHSSPRLITRGRKLHEDQASLSVSNVNPNVVPSTRSSKLTNGTPNEATSSEPARPENVRQDQNHSGRQSQMQSPYTSQSHSPVYFPPPPHPGGQSYGYNAPPPLPIPSPGLPGAPTQSQGYSVYPPYALPQNASQGQLSYPYLYAPMHFPYYAPPPDQLHDRQARSPVLEAICQDENKLQNVPESAPNVPLSTTVARPLPPDRSAALSGYRNIAAIPVSPLLKSMAKMNVSETTESNEEAQGVVFGSFGRPGGIKSPSPVLALHTSSGPESSQPKESMSTTFSVGFDRPATIRIRAKRSRQELKDTSRTQQGFIDSSDKIRIAEGNTGIVSRDNNSNVLQKVIDLTDQETKWVFGTSPGANIEGETSNRQEKRNEPDPPAQQPHLFQPQPQSLMEYLPPMPHQQQVGAYVPASIPMSIAGLPPPSPQGPVNPLPQHIPSLGPLNVGPGFVSPLALASPSISGPSMTSGAINAGDEWEVRDFGYGFGVASGSGYAVERMREERLERERERDTRDFVPVGHGPGRGRRNGYGSHYEGGRGAFGGKRARGGPGAYGRGGPRGGFGRGGHGNYHRHQPSLSVSTGPFQQHHQVPLPHAHSQSQMQQHLPPDMQNGYFVSPSTAPHQYIPSPYGQYNPALFPPTPSSQSITSHHTQPPLPMPVTVLSFPLDPIRQCLLGQVEYYFSIQNLVSDIYLRKQMDSRGWLPINLIASFNRIKQLTVDVQLVKDILSLSSLLEVRGDYVRLANQQWVTFVLPDAPQSSVEPDDSGTLRSQVTADGREERTAEDLERDCDDEEEDDIVFVLGGDE